MTATMSIASHPGGSFCQAQPADYNRLPAVNPHPSLLFGPQDQRTGRTGLTGGLTADTVQRTVAALQSRVAGDRRDDRTIQSESALMFDLGRLQQAGTVPTGIKRGLQADMEKLATLETGGGSSTQDVEAARTATLNDIGRLLTGAESSLPFNSQATTGALTQAEGDLSTLFKVRNEQPGGQSVGRNRLVGEAQDLVAEIRAMPGGDARNALLAIGNDLGAQAANTGPELTEDAQAKLEAAIGAARDTVEGRTSLADAGRTIQARLQEYIPALQAAAASKLTPEQLQSGRPNTFLNGTDGTIDALMGDLQNLAQAAQRGGAPAPAPTPTIPPNPVAVA